MDDYPEKELKNCVKLAEEASEDAMDAAENREGT